MKPYLSLLLIAVITVFTSCQKPEENASLDASTEKMQFAYMGGVPKVVIIDAVNVDWSFVISDDSKEWLSADRKDDRLIVYASDNDTRNERAGSITLLPGNAVTELKDITISVTQTANPKATVLEWELGPLNLNFYSHNSKKQTAVASCDSSPIVECAAVVEDAAATDWIHTVVDKNIITVTVDDNTGTKEREGTVIVTPSNDKMLPKKLKVRQYGIMERPTIKTTTSPVMNFKAVPEHVFDYLSVNLELTNSTYSHSFVDENGNPVVPPSWLIVVEPMIDKNIYFSKQWLCVIVDTNKSPEPRYAYIKVTASGLPPSADDPYEILTITQEGA